MQRVFSALHGLQGTVPPFPVVHLQHHLFRIYLGTRSGTPLSRADAHCGHDRERVAPAGASVSVQHVRQRSGEHRVTERVAGVRAACATVIG